MIGTVLITIWVYYTPAFRDSHNNYPLYYFFIYIIINSVYSLIFSSMALFKTAFFTNISDKNIGGTYMTLLNTIANIGLNWPTTLALYLIEAFSTKACLFDKTSKVTVSASQKKQMVDFLKKFQENTCSTEFEFKVLEFLIII